MFSYINGYVTEKRENLIVIECNNIGYEVIVSNNTLSAIPFENEPIKIFTYMQVKEDGIALFGFVLKEEKELFLKLTSVSGIGPRTAMGILSSFKISDLVGAIISEDLKTLSLAKGLGKKTAERLILELKDKISDFGVIKSLPIFEDVNEDAVSDATDALISLGIGKNEAYRLAKANAGNNATVEQIIAKALKGMGV